MTILLSFLTFGPYHLARLSASQVHGIANGVSVTGLSMSSMDSDYSWETGGAPGVTYAVNDITIEEVAADDWLMHLEPIMDEIQPDVCAIAGYSHPAMLALITLCLRRSIPWILMSDSREIDLQRVKWREWSKGRIVRLASSGFAAGRTHVEYLEKLGIEKGTCSTGYDVVDNDYFDEGARRWRTSTETSSGGEAGAVPPYFLASNRFIPKKNLFRLLSAYAEYTKEKRQSGDTGWALCLLGDGELRSDLISHAKNLGFTVIERAPWEREASRPAEEPEPACGTVFFPGFRQIAELPRFYAHAGAFIHASTTDQWGLVVNEAMASSLPVLVSNLCGCAPELVRDGVNGFTFNPNDVEELASLMKRMSAMEAPQRDALGSAGREIIAAWGLERFATGLTRAAETAVKVGPKKPSAIDRALLYFLSRR
jgi:1,2-diacylglycerol 3-alpha-glucosyltransferase